MTKTGAVIAGMNPVTAVSSTTSQNVAGGAAASSGGAYMVLAFIRSAWPQALPWTVENDAAAIVIATTLIAPLFARVLAFLRHRYKVA